MTLYEKWVGMAYTQDGKLIKKVWNSYLPLEQKIYEYFLTEKKNSLSGVVNELAAQFGMSTVYFIGFLDGISQALDTPPEINEVTEDTPIDISFKWEALYKKMVEYKADHLYNLPEWGNIYTKEETDRLYKEEKTSRTVVNGPKQGRNDPCACGSGKKFKKCCGVG